MSIYTKAGCEGNSTDQKIYVECHIYIYIYTQDYFQRDNIILENLDFSFHNSVYNSSILVCNINSQDYPCRW